MMAPQRHRVPLRLSVPTGRRRAGLARSGASRQATRLEKRQCAALAASARAGLLDLVPAPRRASPLLSFTKPHLWGEGGANEARQARLLRGRRVLLLRKVGVEIIIEATQSRCLALALALAAAAAFLGGRVAIADIAAIAAITALALEVRVQVVVEIRRGSTARRTRE